jgi:hypothetical protein
VIALPHGDKPNPLVSGKVDRFVHGQTPRNLAETMAGVKYLGGRCDWHPFHCGR